MSGGQLEMICYYVNITRMKALSSVAVFCASGIPEDKDIITQASLLGEYLAQHGIRLVYGGGARGVMCAVAEACHNAGGHVTGVLPEIFNNAQVRLKEIQSELIIVPDMHERKKKMYELADAFIVLPGGIGTLEEFFEIYTWKQIGYHRKNIALYNINGFYDPLVSFLDRLVSEGMMSQCVRDSLIVSDSLSSLFIQLQEKECVLPDKIAERSNR